MYKGNAKSIVNLLLPRSNQPSLLGRVVLPTTGQRRGAMLFHVALYPGLEFGAEVSDESLQRPREGLAEG